MPDESPARPPVQDRAVAFAKRHWDWAVVFVLGLYMFFVRMIPFGQLRTEEGTFFIGTDPYYHARQVFFSVEHFPRTLGYDPMTQYPIGTDPGQFGTLFDVIGAGLVWIAGLVADGGRPSTETTMAVFHAYPAILGALTLIPIYLLARHLFGRIPALFVALLTAFLPGEFLVRSLAGYVDHHIIEALFSTLAIWATLKAVAAWEASGMTMELLAEEPQRLWDVDGARRPLLVSLGAAVAFWAYLAAWPSGVLFVGIVGVWVVLDILFEHLRGSDPSPVVLTAVFVFLPVALLMTLHDHRGGFSALNYTWMQPLAALLVALGGAVLGATSLLLRERGLPRWGFLGAATGLVAAGLALIRLVFPQMWNNTISGFSWITGIGVRRTRLTIAEAQPITDQSGGWQGALFDEFGLLWLTAVVGFAFVVVSAARGLRRADNLLIVWSVFATTAVFTQQRFLYYLAVVVVLLNGELFTKLVDTFHYLTRSMTPPAGKRKQRRQDRDQRSPAKAQAFAATVLVLAMLPVNVIGEPGCRGSPGYELAKCFQPGEEALWQDPLEWMRDNTPAVPLSITTQYEEPPKGERFDYPEGTYGVLSWWDYGHQIQFEAHRPPVANPFQQQAPLASRIFTAPNEEQALEILDDYLGEGNEVRYVVIDDAMVSTKYAAITIWADRFDEYRQGGRERFFVPGDPQGLNLPVYGYPVRPWFLQSLYFEDGGGMEHFRLVHESDVYSAIGERGRITDEGFTHLNQNTILTRDTARGTIDNFGSLNFASRDDILNIGGPRIAYNVRVESSVKVYERVAGAVLTGTTEPGATVTASVPLVVHASGREFVHEATAIADDQGRFELRVAYSTGDPVPTSQGGTNVAVTARSPYRVSDGERETRVEVPDLAVLEGSSVPVTFADAPLVLAPR